MPLARILVSDDDPATQRLYRAVLSQHSLEVLVAPGGRADATLALCHAAQPDLVITDINKPDMCGLELCRTIRRDPQLAHIPLLFVSAMGERADREQGRAAGADDYIVKPFYVEELLYRLVVLLAMARDADSRLVTLNMCEPSVEAFHPITGLPGPRILADMLPAHTQRSGWALLTLNIRRYEQLLRAYGIAAGDTLLLRLASLLYDALRRAEVHDYLVAHPAYDWRITLAGLAEQFVGLEDVLQAGFEAELRRLLPAEDIARGGLCYRNGRGESQECSLPALTVRLLDERYGPIRSLAALWNALEE